MIHFAWLWNATAGTVQLSPEKDTTLLSAAASDEADGGGGNRIFAQKAQAYALLDFNLGGVSAPITGAVLKLTQLSNNTGDWDFQVYPMAYQASNYTWEEGLGTAGIPTEASDPADVTGAASYRYRFNGVTDAAWRTAAGVNLSSAAAGSALWQSSIGSVSGTNYVSGTQISITLNAAVLEQFRTAGNSHVTLGVYDATPSNFTLTGNNYFASRQNATVGARPVLEVTSDATLEPGTLFQDEMVLQRGQPMQFWGLGKAGQTVRVYFDNQQIASATVAANRNWAVAAPARADDGGISHTVRITQTGGESITYSDVVMGDVYLAAGQSNMALLMNATDYPDELDSANWPLIRQTAIEVRAASSEQREPVIHSPWTQAVRSNLVSFSRTAYFFAKNLHQANDVPIGLILAADGGQRIDRFLSPAGVAAVPELAGLKRHEEQGGLSNYYDYYNGMIAPLNPYTISGFIWYQGEANRADGDIYRLKMQALIRGWRDLWELGDIPFYYVQLPNYTTTGEDWQELRDVQRRLLTDEANLGMAVTIDIGDNTNIHPVNKQDVGERLARWARHDGGESLAYSGPLFTGQTVSGSQIRIAFSNTNGGLRVGTKNGTAPVQFSTGTLQNFEIAGSNRVFYAATATIDGTAVLVSSSSVSSPHYVRYCHDDVPSGARKLYNASGLPASPFRTDSSFILTVVSGSGSSVLQPGQTRTITAAAPPAGKVFDRWLGATTELANPTSSTTTLTMPARGVYLLATYK